MQTQTASVQHGLVIPGKFVMAVNHDSGRHFDPDTGPLPAQTAKRGEAIVMDRTFVAMLHRDGGAYRDTLVVPFRRGDRAHHAAPITTTATESQRGLMAGDPDLDVDDYHFRMLKPREAANAQRFPRNYIICGNQKEQQMQAGNAVAVNVAHWIGERVAAALNGSNARGETWDQPSRHRRQRPVVDQVRWEWS